MSRNQHNPHCSPLAHHALDCRTVAQIQKSTVELKKRNPISRIFYAKKAEATIAAWRSDLDRILHVFEVRSIVHFLPTLLTIHFQTELALHTHVAVSDVRGLVSDIHRAVVKGQEGVDIQNQTVGTHGVLFVPAKSLQLVRLELGSPI